MWSAPHSCCKRRKRIVYYYAIEATTQYVTLVQTYYPLLGHGDEAHVVLRVAAGLGVTNNIDSILLCLQSRGQKVSIAHILTVVHTKTKYKT